MQHPFADLYARTSGLFLPVPDALVQLMSEFRAVGQRKFSRLRVARRARPFKMAADPEKIIASSDAGIKC
jgi:hypothetical protein